MKVRSIRPRDLASADLARWNEILDSNETLISPFLCAEYVQAAGAVIDEVYVAVLNDGEAYWPFQRHRFGIGGPVGARLSDLQAVIAPPGFTADPVRLIRSLNLTLMDFDHQLASQPMFEPHATVHDVSPFLDLSGGFEAYCQARKQVGSSRISQFQRKGRKLAREVGELRLEYSEKSKDVIDQVFDWKSAQCLRTGVPDFFSWGWTTDTVDHIHNTETDRFTGHLTALYAGDKLVAAHLGMSSRSVLHWWFPGYDHAYGQYSPGGVLLTMLAERAAAEGLARIDLGRGEDSYKTSFASDEVPMLEGSVAPRSLVSTARASRRSSERFLRQSPATAPLRAAVRRARNR